MGMTDEYIEPTPQGRRNLAGLSIVGVVAAVLCRFWLQPTLFRYIQSLPVCDQLPWWQGLLSSALAALLFVASLCSWHALKLLRCGQSPLPGTWVFRRTRIQRGVAVRRRAYLLLFLSALAILAAWHGWQKLSATAIFHPTGKCTSRQAT